MGAVADAALAGGAEVIGVLPAVLARKEIAHPGLTRLELVETMHERKSREFELADAFLVLPGGYGTMDEMVEVVTWAQIAAAHQALHPHQHGWVLGWAAGVSRFGGGGGFSEAEESGADAGGGGGGGDGG